jgi:iron-sulfur cluster assembly protein
MFESIRPVSISERALKEIRQIIHTKNIPSDYGLRVGVKGGGCGVSLIIGFDKKKASDQAYMIEDVPVFIDKKHTMYIIGKEVDFYDGEEGRGFTFIERRTDTYI